MNYIYKLKEGKTYIMKFHIEYVKNIPGAKPYVGMNAKAAQELKVPFHHKHPEHTIVILKKQFPNERKSTIRHEETEEYLMRVKHMHYRPASSKRSAHHWALQYEKLKKPFSVKAIKKLLKDKKTR